MNLFDKKFVYLEWDDSLKGKKVAVGDLLQLMRREVNDGTVKLRCVEDNGDNGGNLHPFIDECGTDWALVYYDPNYECKVAYEQGKVIQCKHIEGSTWSDCTVPPSWYDDYEYRVKLEQSVLYVYTCSDDTLHISPHCTMPGFIFEGTEEECKQYIKEHFCDRCVHQSCAMEAGAQFCEGFKEPKKKRRKTNRELAEWVGLGYGECMCDDIAMSCWRYVCDEADMPVEDGVKIRGWDEEGWREPEVDE